MRPTEDQLRQFSRKPYRTEVIFCYGDQEHRVHLEDISLGGALIKKADNLAVEVGDQVSIRIPFEKQDKSLLVKARVTRFDAAGIGIEFF